MADRRRVVQAKFDDQDYPAYTIGRAAESLGVTQRSCTAWNNPG